METSHLSCSDTPRGNVALLSLGGRRLSAQHQIARRQGALSRALTSLDGKIERIQLPGEVICIVVNII